MGCVGANRSIHWPPSRRKFGADVAQLQKVSLRSPYEFRVPPSNWTASYGVGQCFLELSTKNHRSRLNACSYLPDIMPATLSLLGASNKIADSGTRVPISSSTLGCPARVIRTPLDSLSREPGLAPAPSTSGRFRSWIYVDPLHSPKPKKEATPA